MKIAVLSDIHDNIWNLEKALTIIKNQNSEAIIFCGDFCSPFIPPYFNQLNLPVSVCFGNNDEDQGMIIAKADAKMFKFFPLAEEYGEVELDGKKIAFGHYPKLAELLTKTGDYDAIFHGHNHQAKVENIGKTILANPGAVCGIVGGKPGPASIGIYDTSANKFDLVSI